MCTLILFHHLHPLYPVLLAANRDEFYARPSSGPQILSLEPRIIGGRDDLQGGTWLGLHSNGLLVALTNQRAYLQAEPRPRSRGAVVLDALRASSTDAIHSFLASLDPTDFGPFNLLFGDTSSLFVAYSRPTPASLEIERIPPGLHVLPNDRLNSPRFHKVQRAFSLVESLGISDQPWPLLLPLLRRLLSDDLLPPLDSIPEPPPQSPLSKALLQRLEALCIDTPLYGTSSASLVALQPHRVAHYAFAPSSPQTSDFTDFTYLLQS